MPLRGEDCSASLRAMNVLGLRHEWTSETELRLLPFFPWMSSLQYLDCGNSGTTMRLLCGLIAGRPEVMATLDGDVSLRKRPMKRVVEPLNQMGASITGDYAPLDLVGRQLKAIDYASPVASAQVKSAVLLAGLTAEGTTRISEPSQSRDHTERMLGAMGAPLRRVSPLTVEIGQAEKLDAFDFEVPSDISSAAFWWVAASMIPGSEVTTSDVGLNPTRTGVLDVLRQAGVHVEISDQREDLGEPRGTVTVQGPEGLKPFVIEGDLVPRLIDEIPILAVLATQASGVSRIRDATELRVKESDRIEVTSRHLAAMGANVEPQHDGMEIVGQTALRGAVIDAQHDHRIAMAFAIAGLIADGKTTIEGAGTIRTSYPNFEEHLRALCQTNT